MSRSLHCCVALLVLLAGTARAADEDNLLPVEQAFRPEARAVDRSTVRIEFKIAEDYYLYRERIKLKTADAGVTLGALDLPDGEKKHDEFLGDVEVYHHGLVATQHLSAPADASKIALELRYQGCHQVEPKICFPPQKIALSIDLPGAVAANDSDANGNAGTLSAALVKPSAAGGSLLGSNQPLPAEQAFVFETIATAGGDLLARFTMPKGYYLYRDKTHFRLIDSNDTLAAPRWPPGVSHNDENFGTSTVYFNQVEVPLGLQRADAAAHRVTLETDFQGCLENSVCYPVMTRRVAVELAPGASAVMSGAAPAAAPIATDSSGDQGAVERALHGSRLAGLLSFFAFGLFLAFTPCVFPMIPILSGIIAGAGDNISTRRALVLSLVYILANAVIFTIAGVVAGLAGKNLQAAFQTPWVLWSFAGLFVLLALSMFGFYELQLPSSWQSKLANVSNTQSGGSLTGVAVMGALSALIVGPCVTPPLAAAVIYIAQEHDPLFGGAALFALALGMGAPLLVFGASAGKLLPRAGAWMDVVKAVFGVTFLGLAIWMLSRILAPVWIMLMSGALAVGCAVYLGALDRLPDSASGWRRLWKALGVLLLIAGASELVGAAAGSADLLQPLRGLGAGGAAASVQPALPFTRIKSVADVERELRVAKAAGKPALLDFYADWCVACKEMEKFTFTDGGVRAALAGFRLLQADVTANDDTDQALMQHYRIVGPPDTLFFARDGGERRELQLTGEENAEKFVKRLAAAARP